MSNINLLQETSTETFSEEKKKRIVDNGLIFLLVILLLVAGTYGGAVYAKDKFAAKEVELKATIKDEIDAFSKESRGDNFSDIERVLDFYVRINDAEENIYGKIINQKNGERVGAKLDEATIFSAVENWIIPQAKALSISYENTPDKVTVTTTMNVMDFGHLARQIFSLRESGNFSNISVKDIKRNDKFIDFVIESEFVTKK